MEEIRFHTANGAGMDINHIGRTIVHAPNHDIHINIVLYVPQAKRNLISTHKTSLPFGVSSKFLFDQGSGNEEYNP